MPARPTHAFDPEKATREATAFLQRLIQFDTTNPPGNELACAQYIAEVFAGESLAAEVVEPVPGRGSVVARLPGSGAKRPLLLLSHLDVVPAVAADWRHPPFGGEIADGCVWGRGALDTKNLTALWMSLLLAVKRQGLTPSRDLVFAATGDEEMGGTWGVGWLVEHRPDLVLDCEFALNEGGGAGARLAGRTVYHLQTGEKGIAWTRVTATGTGGHASMPHPDNPVVRLAGALHRIGTTPLPLRLTDTFRLYVERLAAALGPELGPVVKEALGEESAERALAALGDDYEASTIRAMSRNTACPTVVRASDKTNVIPREASALVDCRVLPGQTPEDLLAQLREILGLEGRPEEKIRLELERANPASESPPDTELTRAVEKALAKHDPDATLVPFLSPGGTDGRYLRPRGIVCYGFCPLLPGEDQASVHGVDERLSLRSIEFGLKVLWDVIAELAF